MYAYMCACLQIFDEHAGLCSREWGRRSTKRTMTILEAATASSTVERSLRRWPFCPCVCPFEGVFLLCVSACELFSVDLNGGVESTC